MQFDQKYMLWAHLVNVKIDCPASIRYSKKKQKLYYKNIHYILYIIHIPKVKSTWILNEVDDIEDWSNRITKS